MFSTLFDKVTGLFDKRFVLGLLLPALAFAAGLACLAVTMTGWTRALAWWQHLDGTRQVSLGVAAAAAVVLAATITGSQVNAMTRALEGYWPGRLARPGQAYEGWRRRRLARDTSDAGYLRSYRAFGSGEVTEVMPTRLGNVLRTAESYPGDKERWQLDAVFWWPRLYLVLPDSARSQVDDARAALDQLIVATWLAGAFAVVALALTCAGLALPVGLGCAGGGLLLSRVAYQAAVTAAAAFGELLRACFDLYRGDVLKQLGWAMPPTLDDERELWAALGQQLYRRGVSTARDALLKAPRQPPPAAPAAGP